MKVERWSNRWRDGDGKWNGLGEEGWKMVEMEMVEMEMVRMEMVEMAEKEMGYGRWWRWKW